MLLKITSNAPYFIFAWHLKIIEFFFRPHENTWMSTTSLPKWHERLINNTQSRGFQVKVYDNHPLVIPTTYASLLQFAVVVIAIIPLLLFFSPWHRRMHQITSDSQTIMYIPSSLFEMNWLANAIPSPCFSEWQTKQPHLLFSQFATNPPNVDYHSILLGTPTT
jgi:hypothetical protein